MERCTLPSTENDLCVCIRQDNNETLALINGKLPVKESVDMEELNRYAAIFDMDGLSWSDRSASCRACISIVSCQAGCSAHASHKTTVC